MEMLDIDKQDALAIIGDINGWEVESIEPDIGLPSGWKVVLASTPRVVGDLLPGYDMGSEDGLVFPLRDVDGTVEYEELVRLSRKPVTDPKDPVPGIVMWGKLTCAAESRDPGTFFGTIAFYQDEADGDALMTRASIDTMRLTVDRGLDEVDASIALLKNVGAAVVPHAPRILAQIARLNAILAEGMSD